MMYIIKKQRLKKGTAKDIILSSAETVFSEKGFDGTTVDNIAEYAGVTKKLLYYHFDSKEAILNELFMKHAQDIADRVNTFFPTDTDNVAEFISDFVDALLSFLETKQKIIKIFTIEAIKEQNDVKLLRIIEPIRQLYSKKIEGYIKFKQGSDKLKSDITQLFLGLVPIFTYFAFDYSIASYYNIGRDDLKNKFADIFKNSMLIHSKGFI